jgi:halogenation protein CepH
MPDKITVRGLWKSFPTDQGRLSVLEDVDLTVGDGEFVSLVGPSGCGKSTLLAILTGFERPDRGEALVDGRPIEGPSRRAILIAQRGSVFPWMTVRRNLLFGADTLPEAEREPLARHTIELVGLAGFEERYPWQLSGGMLQRVEMARALVARPDILLMDEPFGALDALTRMRMRTELLRILARDRHTCLLVTHDVEEALHLSDRILVISPRPARVQRIVEVDVPHPRALSSPRLAELKEQVLGELGLSPRPAAGGRAPAGRRAPLHAVAAPARSAPPHDPRHAVRPPAPTTSAAERADVVIVGGGPAGASTAALLAEAGLRVLVLERERFPRYHVGESLLPALWELWDRLGVTAAIEAAGFVPKQGIRFAMFDDPEDVLLLTAEHPEYFPRSHAFHVDRARFDALLLENARAKGAEVREGWTVSDVSLRDGWATGVLAAPAGEAPRAIEASVVVDATGRDCLLARKMGWRRPDRALNKVSHFTQFAGVRPPQAPALPAAARSLPGSTTTDVYTVEGGWAWYIPLPGDVASVGVVLDARRSGRLDGSPQAVLERALAECERLRAPLADARPLLPVQTVSGISYVSESFVGNGFVLVGDASMFVDPIFSAGVTLAVRGGVYAADCILDAFQQGDFSAARLRPYERRIRQPMDRIFEMIRRWYTILESRQPNDLIRRSRDIPWLRERLIVLLSGGYEKIDLESFLLAMDAVA